jgi:hypothetical protein
MKTATGICDGQKSSGIIVGIAGFGEGGENLVEDFLREIAHGSEERYGGRRLGLGKTSSLATGCCRRGHL